MQASISLLGKRRFLPLFVTQFLGAFNDNLFKTALVLLVTFHIYSDAAKEAAFNAIAGGLFILPFFLFSALAGQLADGNDKARIIRIVKTAEIAIMLFGAVGLLLPSVTLLLAALFAMGVHSAFFGPIKYAILPQHLREKEVLGGTGLVEAGTYAAILGGTIVGGIIPPAAAAGMVLMVAAAGWLAGRQVPPAPPVVEDHRCDWHIVRASIRLVRDAMRVRRLDLAILCISFFWAVGTILASQFPPLVKNEFNANQQVATLFLALFSVGVAVGSIAINRLLKGEVSARFSPVSALVMSAFIIDLFWAASHWTHGGDGTLNLRQFIRHPEAIRVMFDLFGVAVAGGMFVVPLYAFLQITVPPTDTARTIAANNIVNSAFMVIAALLAALLAMLNFSVPQILLLVAVGGILASFIAWRLHRVCETALCEEEREKDEAARKGEGKGADIV
ncbi:MFS transporter [Tardibacter chloracetimidivorans]|uniref:MFS transporter n=1 Tax=Tardibacter chloracetimidivorans TaxID=1921510 RepID=A0A1L3ZXJ3_9SPHN|nr:MFS transporter [Tardibacter chloracetimidivorans]API60335.1 MFS transporter [Tardibacter chloracetimidivorans]